MLYQCPLFRGSTVLLKLLYSKEAPCLSPVAKGKEVIASSGRWQQLPLSVNTIDNIPLRKSITSFKITSSQTPDKAQLFQGLTLATRFMILVVNRIRSVHSMNTHDLTGVLQINM